MKVLLLGRSGLFENLGGDRIQIEQTAKHLRLLGVDVEIATDTYPNVVNYDLIHVFQLDWNLDSYFQIKLAKKYRKPVVFSPIHHNINELKKFDDEYVFDFRRLSKILFKDQFHRDLFKEFYRSLFQPARLWIVFYAMLYGLKAMYTHALKLSDVVLVQTKLEAADLIQTFNVDFKWRLVKNGVGDAYLNPSTKNTNNPLNFSDYIICVGRIEPRKNQLSIIEAIKQLRTETGTDIKLVFIGATAKKKHFEYVSKFNTLLKTHSWITHINKVEYEQMPDYYRQAKVGISASWFETTGLTSLEAVFCGATAVAAGNRAREYLGDYAYYCDPSNIESIKEAIKTAYFAPRKTIPDNLKLEYTWKKTAEDTFDVYNKLLGIKL